jgi:hypothetical protein
MVSTFDAGLLDAAIAFWKESSNESLMGFTLPFSRIVILTVR